MYVGREAGVVKIGAPFEVFKIGRYPFYTAYHPLDFLTFFVFLLPELYTNW